MATIKGTGSIIQKRRGVFEVQLSCGKDPTTGRYRRISRTIHGTKRDAAKALDKLRTELEGGLSIDSQTITFRQWSKEFMASRRESGRVGASTLANDQNMLDLICSILGDVPLCKLDARMVKNLFPEIRKRREAQGYHCSNSTLHHYHALLKTCLKAAVNLDLLMRNPVDKVEAPRRDTVARRALDANEAGRLLHCIDVSEQAALEALADKESRQRPSDVQDRDFLRGIRDVSYVLLVRLALATGARQGELMAATWRELDFASSRFTIAQAMGNGGEIKQPKTQSGIRSIYVDQSTMMHLAAWKQLQAELLATIEVTQDDSTPCFCSSVGDFLDKSGFQKWWRAWRTKNGFETLKLHELRHTMATQLLGAGIDVKTVRARLGHANASLTLNTYSHALPARDEAAANVIASLYSAHSEPVLIEAQIA